MAEMNVVTDEEDWCADLTKGVSESILGARLHKAGVQIRPFPVAAAIMRPPYNLDCQPLQPQFKYGGRHARTHLSLFTCQAADKAIQEHHAALQAGSMPMTDILRQRSFRLRGKSSDDYNTCLTMEKNASSAFGHSLNPQPCHYPVPPEQMFGSKGDSMFGFLTEPKYPWHNPQKITKLPVSPNVADAWSREPVELYEYQTLDHENDETRLITHGPPQTA
ncbi:expressed unknown protein [Seminavis robusta]|uniref:Uncharacterized protein n=1 Tax=Seminavis robusta TaxID=568900 RepID=A0A9N8HSW4_9STRA|nr:expressed unknown protein [Seminavis robusta]|eukprot:Sro1499_g277760.1 n/a (220) ;mRNA; f:11538-12197